MAVASVDVVHDRFHFRHAPKWAGRFAPQGGEEPGVLLCVACVVEMMESPDVSVGRSPETF